jgi:glucose-1-phosphate cytidylyltransferase
MKVVILAGGLGTRIAEESGVRPKPMIEIGNKPILWHIMKIYEHYGFNEFIICLGYKGNMIKEYFVNYFLFNSDLTVDLKNNQLEVHTTNTESFKITLVDTGIDTNTAGRIKKIKKYLNDDDAFMLTYGDGVTDLNITDLVQFHKKHGKLATLTAIQPPGRFGNIVSNEDGVIFKFQEKPQDEGLWINGGFFVLNKEIFKYLEGDVENLQWEREPLTAIAEKGELVAYRHTGFWKCMDALRDKIELEQEWDSGKAPWKIW